MQRPKRLLVMRLSAMGDVAMTVPVLLALRRTYPEVGIIALSRKRFFPILHQIPGISLIEADVNKRHSGVFGLRRLAMEIEKYQTDAIADLHNVLRTKTLRLFLKRIQSAKVSKGRKERKRLIKDPKFFEQLKPIVHRYVDVVDELGLSVKLDSKDILPQLDIPQKVIDLMGDHKCRWVGVAPFAAHRSKSLSVDKAKELIQSIEKIENIKVVLFGGGEQESKQLELVAAAFDNVYSLAGIMTFEEELQMISNLDAMIAMDSGNGHLAAMYGVPVITLWGNTHPFAGFQPFMQSKENQITASREQFPLIPTSIYGNKVPDGYENVMDSIDCDLVVERLLEVLN